jgi:hypothetical protein
MQSAAGNWPIIRNQQTAHHPHPLIIHQIALQTSFTATTSTYPFCVVYLFS